MPLCENSKRESGTILEKAATTFWTMRSRRTHLAFFFFVFSSNYELVCVLGAGRSMTECFNLYKQAKTVKTLFFSFFFSFLCCRLIQSCFVSPGREEKKNPVCSASYEWRIFCIVEYCTENCGVIWLYLFLKSGTHFEFWFVLNTVFLALLLDHVNVKTSK